MKGVLIPDLELPESCAECPCLRHDSLDGEHAYQCNITLRIRKNIDRKPKWCPIISEDWKLPKNQLPAVPSHIYATCKAEGRKNYVIDSVYAPNKYNNPTGWGNIPMINSGKAEVIAWMYHEYPEPYEEE